MQSQLGIYATFLRVVFVLRWLSLRQGTARTSKEYRTSYKPYFGRCILNHVLIIRRDFGVIKQKMRQYIAILLCFNVCLMYFRFLGVFFSLFGTGFVGVSYRSGDSVVFRLPEMSTVRITASRNSLPPQTSHEN